MPRPRTPKGPRKIEASQKGRVYWKPGDPHPLDALYTELDQARDELPGLLEDLLSTAQHTVMRLSAIVEAAKSDTLTDAFSQADNEARLIALQRFGNRKHLHHLLAAFALQRHKRQLGRLRTIEAALTLANDLLVEETSLSQEFLAAWQTARRQPPPDTEATETEAEHTETENEEAKPPLTKEELRVQGLEEPLEPIVSSADQGRRLLREFEARLPDLRRQLSTGQGWFEVFSVPKRHYKDEVIAYWKALSRFQNKQIPIPAEIERAVHPEVRQFLQAGTYKFPPALRDEVYNITYVGPYVKYRWTEHRQTYTISLGMDDDYPPFPFVPEGF
jgi:hypothetical protein